MQKKTEEKNEIGIVYMRTNMYSDFRPQTIQIQKKKMQGRSGNEKEKQKKKLVKWNTLWRNPYDVNECWSWLNDSFKLNTQPPNRRDIDGVCERERERD